MENLTKLIEHGFGKDTFATTDKGLFTTYLDRITTFDRIPYKFSFNPETNEILKKYKVSKDTISVRGWFSLVKINDKEECLDYTFCIEGVDNKTYPRTITVANFERTKCNNGLYFAKINILLCCTPTFENLTILRFINTINNSHLLDQKEDNPKNIASLTIENKDFKENEFQTVFIPLKLMFLIDTETIMDRPIKSISILTMERPYSSYTRVIAVDENGDYGLFNDQILEE